MITMEDNPVLSEEQGNDLLLQAGITVAIVTAVGYIWSPKAAATVATLFAVGNLAMAKIAQANK